MADLRHKQHLFFDLDDTLWDFQKNSAHAIQQLYAEFELEAKLNAPFETFLSAYKTINNQFWSRYYKREIDKHYLRNHRFNEAFKLFGYDNFEENLEVTDLYLKRAPLGTYLKEGCVEILDYLKDNYQLHIITNGFKEVQDIKLKGCGLGPYFKNIIISEEHQLIKPEEKIFRLGESLALCKASDCVMIGDSLESDVQGALNAGWDAIYFNEVIEPEYRGHSISRLEQLKHFF